VPCPRAALGPRSGGSRLRWRSDRKGLDVPRQSAHGESVPPLRHSLFRSVSSQIGMGFPLQVQVEYLLQGTERLEPPAAGVQKTASPLDIHMAVRLLNAVSGAYARSPAG
jgi:hypothetical protein